MMGEPIINYTVFKIIESKQKKKQNKKSTTKKTKQIDVE